MKIGLIGFCATIATKWNNSKWSKRIEFWPAGPA